MALPPPPLPTLNLNFTLNLYCKETPVYDDYPEPPPPPARCPNCNEELTDHPRPDLFFLDDSGAICDGPDGCGWWGTWQQAEEYALDVGEAHAEAMADDGPDWRSGAPRRAIPMPGVVPFEEDPELSRWLARHGYESADEWMRDSDYALSDGGWFTLDGVHGPFEPADAMAGAKEAEMLALAAEEAAS